ncbi:hypothetical protein IMSAG049_00438 [Clostridiales bacterium]|nr:hypothetical protein IMSAG049_00438 [Clostridiales bacterium]
MFSTPCLFSILAIITIDEQFLSSSILLILSTSPAVLTKEAAIKSNSLSIAKFISSISFSLMYGMETIVPGKLIPLLSDIGPGFTTTHFTSVSFLSITLSSIRPSSSSTFVPTLTSLGKSS